MSRLAQLEKMWVTDQSDADVAYMIAQEHVSGGDHGAAIEWFDKCLAIDPEYLYAYFHKARALEEAGRESEAIATARAGLARAQAAGDAKATDELSELIKALAE